MRILTAASMAVALIVSTAAFAATTPAASTPAATQQQAPEPGQPQLKQQQKPAVHRAALHRRDVIGDRETAALNSLEASGYYTIKDIAPDGKNIAADAKKPGAGFMHLTVLPDGTIQTAATPAT